MLVPKFGEKYMNSMQKCILERGLSQGYHNILIAFCLYVCVSEHTDQISMRRKVGKGKFRSNLLYEDQ